MYRSEKQDVLQRIAFAADERASPMLLDALHDRDASFWAHEALIHYLPLTPPLRDRIVADMRARGMPPSGIGVPKGIGCGEDVIVSIIEASLDPARRAGWEGGALGAQQYPDNRLMAHLIAIATTDGAPGRIQAIFAIAFNRTDEGVAALQKLIAAGPAELRRFAADAVRAAYRDRSSATRGRPLLVSDFPELAR